MASGGPPPVMMKMMSKTLKPPTSVIVITIRNTGMICGSTMYQSRWARVRAVEPRRVDEIDVDVAQRRQQDHDDEARARPDRRDEHGVQGGVGIAEPPGREVAEADRAQQPR